MIFDPTTTPQLKPWLVRTLEPICDAEPGALADYILALLKHNVSEGEMRKELTVQLEEFLEKECSPFIDTLFTVLRTQSYLPYGESPTTSYSSPPNIDTGIPIPLDGLISPSMSSQAESSRKRGLEHDDRDGQGPSKGPRLSSDGRFSRQPNGRIDGRGWRGRGDYKGGGDHGRSGFTGNEGDMNGGVGYANGRRQTYRPPDQRRGICRDYHNNGYCARGALCKYSHGDDAVVPNQFFAMNGGMPGGLPFMPIFPGAMPFDMGGTYDPHQARMDMRPAQNGRNMRAPLLPRIQQEDGKIVHPINASGELPVIQDLTPQMSQAESSPPADSNSAPQPIQAHVPSDLQNGDLPHSFGMNGHFPETNQSHQFADAGIDVDMTPPITSRGGFRGRGYGVGRGRGGVFTGEVHNFQRPERRKDKTLVVEKIPTEKLSLDQVNGWFKQFGTVTNVAVDVNGGKALVSFSTHEEAHAAWKSEEAVFGNRFVKVFWHRPLEGQGQAGSRMLAASAPLVATISNKDTLAQPPLAPTPSSSSTSTAPRKSSATNALAAKQQLLEQQIAEQKSLMASLSSVPTEEKKTIMARLRKLGEEMTSKSTPTPPAPSKTPPSTDDAEQKKKELLDKQLEILRPASGETTEDLQAKLERLKAEAASLGISEQTHHPPVYGGYRPYRGRGRGAPRGFYRGAMRGGPPRASMKLDNRPKKLLIKGVKEVDIQALRDWYETTGQLESAEMSEEGNAVVSFRSRAAAEQGLAKGNRIPTIPDPVQISWYAQAGNAIKAGALSDKKDSDHRPSLEPESEPDVVPSSHLDEEEEVVTSGWGGYGDGDDSMGML